MLIWCLKQPKDFILKFSISESFFFTKSILEKVQSITSFLLISFPQMDVLLRLSTIEQIIQDKNMFISFSIINLKSYISIILTDSVKLLELCLIHTID